MRRWGLVATGLAAVALVGAPWWGPPALRPLRFFGVRRVVVEGARYLSPAAVVQAMELGSEASVFDDLGVIAERIRSAGGIEDVAVSRRLPGTLEVRIREVEPVGLATGPSGLVPVGRDGRPLPYDVLASPVDAPIVPDADPRLMAALATVRATDAGLFADVASAQKNRDEVVLDLDGGRVRLPMPVNAEVVRAVALVRRDLAARGLTWRELDGRFRGWVVVKPERRSLGGSARPSPGV